MGGVAEGVEAGEHLQGDAGIGVPDVGLRDAQQLGEAALAVHPHPAGAGAQVTPAGEAVAALPAHDVALAVDDVERPLRVDRREVVGGHVQPAAGCISPAVSSRSMARAT